MDSDNSQRAKRIIVLNDSMDLLNLMQDLLEEEGYEVLLQHSSSGAHAFITSNKPDLIILDFVLQEPDDGWVVLQMLKLDPATVTIPVIVSSADSRLFREKQERLRELNCLTIEKPFDLDEMLAKVSEALEL